MAPRNNRAQQRPLLSIAENPHPPFISRPLRVIRTAAAAARMYVCGGYIQQRKGKLRTTHTNSISWYNFLLYCYEERHIIARFSTLLYTLMVIRLRPSKT